MSDLSEKLDAIPEAAVDAAAKALMVYDEQVSRGIEPSYTRAAHSILEAANLPLLALVHEQAAKLARVEGLADMWTKRGEHDMAFSKTIPDEDIAMALLTNGAGMVENARHIRNAIRRHHRDDQ